MEVIKSLSTAVEPAGIVTDSVCNLIQTVCVHYLKQAMISRLQKFCVRSSEAPPDICFFFLMSTLGFAQAKSNKLASPSQLPT